MTSHVTHLFVKSEHGQPMAPRTSLQTVTGRGISGDAAFGTSRRQVLLIDQETLSDFQLEPGAVRENIVTRGISLDVLEPGTHLKIGEAVLEITGACTPCDYIESLRQGLRQEIEGRRGVLARIARGGTISIGAPILLQPESALSASDHG